MKCYYKLKKTLAFNFTNFVQTIKENLIIKKKK